MTNPFGSYPPEWIDDPSNPIVFVIRAERFWAFMEDQGCDPLTDEEWKLLPFAFTDTD